MQAERDERRPAEGGIGRSFSCPHPGDVPPPPFGREGWPWTDQIAATEPRAGTWPRITVVTPSFNQGAFIEETIRSILLQGYPDLEYIVIDAGSEDETLDVLRKYEKYISYWVSERDRGQAHAINKGLEKATGTIFNWINSDDLLEPGALHAVARAWRENAIVAGPVRLFSPATTSFESNDNLSTKSLVLGGSGYAQPGVWLDLAKVREVGPFDESYHYCFDRKHLAIYLDRYPDVSAVSSPLAGYRLHDDSKSVSIPEGFVSDTSRLQREIGALLRSPENVSAVGRNARFLAWYDEISEILCAGRGGAVTAARLIRSAMRDPRVRFNRALLGALRRAAMRQLPE